MQQNIGFIGAGRMGRALASGLVQAGLVRAEQLSASDPSAAARSEFASAVPKATVVDNNAEVLRSSDIVFLAVKPQHVEDVLAELRPEATVEKLLVSIAAGISLQTLSDGLQTDRLIRVMPNTPCLVRFGACGYCLGTGASSDDGKLVARLLQSVGIAHQLDETMMDAVTGLSGSGPAFVYVMIEALSDGGVRMGLPHDVALKLAAHTVRGAAEMVVATGRHPADLKDEVTSPGGTTITGLQALEKGGMRAAMIAAVEAATRRCVELGES